MWQLLDAPPGLQAAKQQCLLGVGCLRLVAHVWEHLDAYTGLQAAKQPCLVVPHGCWQVYGSSKTPIQACRQQQEFCNLEQHN